VEQFVSLLPLIGIALLFWLLIIRPASRRQKALSRLQNSLEPGNEVMMSAGIYGTIEQIVDDRVHLRVADGVTLQVARGAINTVVPAESPGTADPQ
jgi:preprotein translocase subunit YajC